MLMGDTQIFDTVRVGDDIVIQVELGKLGFWGFVFSVKEVLVGEN